MIEIIKKFIKSKSFKTEFHLIFIRCLLLVAILILNISKTITIKFGKKSFIFRYHPILKSKTGGKGLFVFREKIEPLMEYGHQFLNPGDVVIDGGANQGIFSNAFASCVTNSGLVIAVEPFEYCHKIISENSNINKFTNIRLLQNVLSDREDNFNLDYSHGIGSASITRNFGYKKKLLVSSITIDHICSKYNLLRLNFIKLDIEGAELLALKGATKSISRFKPIICLESKILQFIEIRDFLISYNYQAYLFDFRGKLNKVSHLNKDEANVFFLPKI